MFVDFVSHGGAESEHEAMHEGKLSLLVPFMVSLTDNSLSTLQGTAVACLGQRLICAKVHIHCKEFCI